MSGRGAEVQGIMTGMFGQMMLLPISMFAGWMNVLASAMQGLQPAQGRPLGPYCGGGPAPAPTGFKPTGFENVANVANQEAKEEQKMSDRCGCDHRDKTVKLVEYSIVTIKPCNERIIFKGEEIYVDEMNNEAFAAWVIALYLQDPKHKPIPHDEKRFLRVFHRVLEEWPRPDDCCDDRQVDVLREINQAIRELGRTVGGGRREEVPAS
jgi:hypothetical protein